MFGLLVYPDFVSQTFDDFDSLYGEGAFHIMQHINTEGFIGINWSSSKQALRIR